jgi:curved DNA-binding protein CbpA
VAVVQDYYQVLGVRRDATEAQIKTAFRNKAKRYHPDHNRGVEIWAGKKLQGIVEAYYVLGNPGSRRIYDYCLARGKEYTVSSEIMRPQTKTTAESMVDLMRRGDVPIMARVMAFGWVFLDNFYKETGRGGAGK